MVWCSRSANEDQGGPFQRFGTVRGSSFHDTHPPMMSWIVCPVMQFTPGQTPHNPDRGWLPSGQNIPQIAIL
jgi:hypothetical protein